LLFLFNRLFASVTPLPMRSDWCAKESMPPDQLLPLCQRLCARKRKFAAMQASTRASS
jgi:hypothetical protein